jgi:hypothetical protein
MVYLRRYGVGRELYEPAPGSGMTERRHHMTERRKTQFERAWPLSEAV